MNLVKAVCASGLRIEEKSGSLNESKKFSRSCGMFMFPMPL